MKIFLAAILLAAPAAQGQIFADVSTSLGDFTIQLFHLQSPKTVANFIRLADGSAPWVDEATGRVQYNRPFYDGISFHRVVAGSLSQTGSPNGQGTDGPGFMFRDEVANGLVFDSAYEVGMANSGPNTNGSQIFITAAAQPFLNGKNTIFGQVVAGPGRTVCDAINAVPTDTNDKPTTPLVIESVAIRKVGVVFDESAQGLPEVSAPPLRLRHDASGTALLFAQPARTLATAWHSPDFAVWSPVERYLDFQAAPTDSLDMSAEASGQARCYFAVSMVNYPGDAIFPGSLANRTLMANITSFAVVTYHFDGNGRGTYDIDGGLSGTISSYAYTPDGYGGSLLVFTDSMVPLHYRLGYDSATTLLLAGRLSGTADPSNPFSFDGTFTLTR